MTAFTSIVCNGIDILAHWAFPLIVVYQTVGFARFFIRFFFFRFYWFCGRLFFFWSIISRFGFLFAALLRRFFLRLFLFGFFLLCRFLLGYFLRSYIYLGNDLFLLIVVLLRFRTPYLNRLVHPLVDLGFLLFLGKHYLFGHLGIVIIFSNRFFDLGCSFGLSYLLYLSIIALISRTLCHYHIIRSKNISCARLSTLLRLRHCDRLSLLSLPIALTALHTLLHTLSALNKACISTHRSLLLLSVSTRLRLLLRCIWTGHRIILSDIFVNYTTSCDSLCTLLCTAALTSRCIVAVYRTALRTFPLPEISRFVGLILFRGTHYHILESGNIFALIFVLFLRLFLTGLILYDRLFALTQATHFSFYLLLYKLRRTVLLLLRLGFCFYRNTLYPYHFAVGTHYFTVFLAVFWGFRFILLFYRFLSLFLWRFGGRCFLLERCHSRRIWCGCRCSIYTGLYRIRTIGSRITGLYRSLLIIHSGTCAILRSISKVRLTCGHCLIKLWRITSIWILLRKIAVTWATLRLIIYTGILTEAVVSVRNRSLLSRLLLCTHSIRSTRTEIVLSGTCAGICTSGIVLWHTRFVIVLSGTCSGCILLERLIIRSCRLLRICRRGLCRSVCRLLRITLSIGRLIRHSRHLSRHLIAVYGRILRYSPHLIGVSSIHTHICGVRHLSRRIWKARRIHLRSISPVIYCCLLLCCLSGSIFNGKIYFSLFVHYITSSADEIIDIPFGICSPFGCWC